MQPETGTGRPRALQNPIEFDELLAIVRDLKPRRILEIGSYWGGTLWHWKQIATEMVYAIDLEHVNADLYDDWEGVPACIDYGRSQDPATVQRALQMGGGRLNPTSPPYDFVFVDGDHDREAARRDIELYWPLLRVGGVMAIHDVEIQGDPPGRLVAEVWRELLAGGVVLADRTQTIVGPRDTHPLGIGVAWK